MLDQTFNIFFVLLCIKMCAFELVENSKTTEDFVPRVVNGWPAKLGDVPYQISFKQIVSRTNKEYGTFCGGVLIAKDKLVSAAHCFEEKGSKCFGRGVVSRRTLSKTFAVAGNLYNRATYKSVDSIDGGQWRVLKSMLYPKTYKFPKDDISVGFTKTPFKLNDTVGIIPFTNRFADYTGKCLVSGYGRVSKHSGSEVLLLAHLELIPRAICSSKHKRNMVKFVCTDTYLADVGKGDSGGPLVCSKTGDPKESRKGILVGIVSGTRPTVGSFFTRVSSYSKYIERGTGTLSQPNKALVWLSLIYWCVIFILFYLDITMLYYRRPLILLDILIFGIDS